MNNEPVAWMYRVNYSFTTFSTIEPPDDAYDGGTLVPLYTHPVQKPMMVLDGNRVYPAFKELTDEEIKAEMGCVSSSYPSVGGLIEFARAILRKAQEK